MTATAISLTGQTTIDTGLSTGFSAGIAKELGRAGAKVVNYAGNREGYAPLN